MGSIIASVVWLLLVDVLFVAAFVGALAVLGNWNRAAFAVLKRNFVGYLSSPTGYVFIFFFVLLTSFASFWPADFFNSNIASFDQLSFYIPMIMLVFIPAITMSIWAEERRQGTDELLLTLPATDFDIVIGKYLAAASIFTAAMLFSQICGFIVLAALSEGDLDTGMLLTTYLGYWLMGLAMLALGMVASFLTSNLTIGFVLGAIINAPLVGIMFANWFIPFTGLARSVTHWSLAKQAEVFGRGAISFSSLVYFILIAALGVYLSMILIGRRHWSGGRDGESLLGHYLVRVISLVAIVFGANIWLSNVGGQYDATEGRVNSPSSDTLRIIGNLDAKHTVQIEAYIGAEIPEDYSKTRLELISMLRSFETKSRGKIKVTIYDNLEPFSDEARQAEKRYNIRPRQLQSRSRGVIRDEQVLLGAGFTSGLEKVVVPFFDYGIPVEYELLRSINTVAKAARKKLGIVHTDAQMMGGFEFNGMQPANTPKQLIIEELEKQYEVEVVEPNQPIELGKFDVLVVVQPSSLGPQELQNVVEVVKKGQPTAIFEDPLPAMISAPGTGQPKRQNPMASMFGGGQPPAPKGNMNDLWKAIGVKPEGEDRGPGNFQSRILWQRFNPYKKIQVAALGDEYVFIRHDAPGVGEAFNSKDPITSGIEEVLFPFPGSISPDPDNKDIKFTTLVETSKNSGTITIEDLQSSRESPESLNSKRGPYVGKFTVAARLQGTAKESDKTGDKSDKHASDQLKPDGEKKKASEAEQTKPLNVVYVADIDLLTSQFVRFREQPDQEFRWRFENVTFVLNVIDVLAGEMDYVGVRKRKTHFSTLRAIERFADGAREEELNEQRKYEDNSKSATLKAESARDESVKKFQEMLNDLNEKQKKGELVDRGELQAAVMRLQMKEQVANQVLDSEKERLRREASDKIREIRRDKDLQIESLKWWFKLLAVIIPPIPPLLIGLVVFVWRQLREREGISKDRMV